MTNTTPTPAPRLCTMTGYDYPCFDMAHYHSHEHRESDEAGFFDVYVTTYDSKNNELSEAQYWFTYDSCDVECGVEEAIQLNIHTSRYPWYDVQHAIEKGVIEDNDGYTHCKTPDGRILIFPTNTLAANHFKGYGFKPRSFIDGTDAQAMQADRERFACVKSWEGSDV